jgi:hypothetical protein
MKKNFISAAVLIAASSFTAQAVATTTIGLQDVSAGTTLIDNKWQIFSFSGPNPVQTSSPYSKATSDGLGDITLSPIVNFNDNSHIHVNGGDGNPSTPTVPFIHGDVGGVFVSGSGSHDVFSFQSMDVNHAVLQSTLGNPNATITVRGFLGGVNGMTEGILEPNRTTMKYKGGTQVAETTIANGFTGTIDFLAANAGFCEVDYVEFFFTDFYRVKPSSLGDTALDFEFDNIVVGATVSAVPVPAAVWLFGTGIIGLVSFGKRKHTALAA